MQMALKETLTELHSRLHLSWSSVSVSCIFQRVITQIKCVGVYSVRRWNRMRVFVHAPDFRNQDKP